MTDALILTDVRGEGNRRTSLITLNRPKQLNALNDALMDQLGAALLAARLIHPFGITVTRAAHPLRIGGAVATNLVQLGLIILLMLQHFA